LGYRGAQGRLPAAPSARLDAVLRIDDHGRVRVFTLDRPEARSAANGEEEMFRRLIGGPANREAIAAFLERREPDVSRLEQ